MNPSYPNLGPVNDNDSVFISFPKEQYEEFLRRGTVLRRSILIFTVIIYGISLFSLIWFLWIPAKAIENNLNFFHSPTFFFITVWIAITFMLIFLCFYYMWRSAVKKNEMVIEVTEIAKEVYLLENNNQIMK